MKKNKGISRKVDFIFVLGDMLKTVGVWFWAVAFVTCLVVISVFLICNIVLDPNKLPKDLVTIIPVIMGFLISGLAIIMGFNKETLRRLSIPADDNEIPLKVVVASFSVSLLILLVTLGVSLMYIDLDLVCVGCRRLWSALVLSGAVISMESMVHIIIHLFATGTFLVYDNKELTV